MTLSADTTLNGSSNWVEMEKTFLLTKMVHKAPVYLERIYLLAAPLLLLLLLL